MNSFTRRLEKNPLVASRLIDGEVLLVPVRQRGPEVKKVYRLQDPVASRVWQLIDGRRTMPQIQRRICREFEVDGQRAEKDLYRFLKHLEQTGVVRARKERSSGRRVTKRKLESPAPVNPTGPATLSIGGIGFFLEGLAPRMGGWPQGFYKAFLGTGEERVRIRVRSDGCPNFSGKQAIFDAEGHWRLYRYGSAYLFEIFDTMTGERHTAASVSDDFREADVYVFPASSQNSPPPWSLPRLMQPLGQLLLMNSLASLDGVMVHALAIDDGGRGAVFVGPSGAGKSTLGRFWRCQRGVRVLSDEHVILRRQGGRLYAYGTPWSGTQLAVTPHPGPVEVHRIFLISHDREHRVWNEPEGAFASHLFSQLFLPFWNQKAIRVALEFCRQLVLTSPCQRLGFAKHASIINFLRSHPRGGTR